MVQQPGVPRSGQPLTDYINSPKKKRIADWRHPEGLRRLRGCYRLPKIYLCQYGWAQDLEVSNQVSKQTS